LIVRLLRVYRAARVVACATSERPGLYRIPAGDVLHLRTVVEAAGTVVNEDGVIG
jgi:hypothetical protein